MFEDFILVAAVFSVGVVMVIALSVLGYVALSYWLNKEGRQL